MECGDIGGGGGPDGAGSGVIWVVVEVLWRGVVTLRVCGVGGGSGGGRATPACSGCRHDKDIKAVDSRRWVTGVGRPSPDPVSAIF